MRAVVSTDKGELWKRATLTAIHMMTVSLPLFSITSQGGVRHRRATLQAALSRHLCPAQLHTLPYPVLGPYC